MPVPPDRLVATLLAAEDRFYRAFAAGDAARMEGLWCRRHPVACVHPARPPLIGRQAVMSAWRALLSAPTEISHETLAVLPGTEQAAVIGLEHIGGEILTATNIYALEEGDWLLCHHHAGLVLVDRIAAAPSTKSVH